MKIKIFLNKVYLHSANMIMLEADVKRFSIDKNNEGKTYITIDGATFVDEKDVINSIEFLHYGYNSKIAINNNAGIYTAKIEYTKKLYFKDFSSCVKFIKKLEN